MRCQDHKLIKGVESPCNARAQYAVVMKNCNDATVHVCGVHVRKYKKPASMYGCRITINLLEDNS